MRIMKKYALLISVCAIAGTASAGDAPRKNVLFIAVDDLKPILGCYGDKMIKTPNIDEISARGTLFTHCYCQQAISGPSRTSLLTGKRPDYTQVWDLKTKMREVRPGIVTIPQHFRDNGYHSAGVGKIFDYRNVKNNDTVSWSQRYIDYREFFNPRYVQPYANYYQDPEFRKIYEKKLSEGRFAGLKGAALNQYALKSVNRSMESVDVPDDAYADGAITNAAVKFISGYESEKPFFLAVGFMRPHLPFVAPEKYFELYDRESIPLAQFRRKAADSPNIAYHNSGELKSYSDIPAIYSYNDIENTVLFRYEQRRLIHAYYACVSYIDAQIGRLIGVLREKGVYDDTIIVLWGDHGWHLGDHGLWGKNTNFEQATRSPLIISATGLSAGVSETPTEFVDIFPTLCQLARLDTPGGLDGISLVAQISGTTGERYAVSQISSGGTMGYSIRTGRYRYTIWFDWKNRILDTGRITAEELYDYSADPHETKNRITDRSCEIALEQMRSIWEQYKLKNNL